MHVGLVTFTSVSQSPITSSPAKTMPAFTSSRAHGLADLAVARRDRLRHAAAAGGEVAARLARLRDAREAMREGLAVDHQHALVALRDLAG